jgi:hypothetical protein
LSRGEECPDLGEIAGKGTIVVRIGRKCTANFNKDLLDVFSKPNREAVG